MSDKNNKTVSDESLDSVAGGITSLDMSGSSSGGDQTVLDQSTTIIHDSEVTYGDKSVDIGDKTDIGDKVGGNKVDTDVSAKVNVKRSVF